MAVALKNLNQLQRLSQPTAAAPFQLYQAARLFDEIRGTVEMQWDDITPPDKEKLTALAYKLSDTPSGMERFSHALVLLKGDTDAITKFYYSRKRFIDAIFNQIERQNSDYQQALACSLDSVTDTSQHGPELNNDNISDWLRKF
jgi:hypothetical protein